MPQSGLTAEDNSSTTLKPNSDSRSATQGLPHRLRLPASWLGLAIAATLTGCSGGLPGEAQSQRPGGGQGQGPTAVDVAIARRQPLQTPLEFTGTTQPQREVSLRSQVEGKLLNLNVDVGDTVQRGQVVAQVDDSILTTAVAAAEAELAARQADVLRAKTQVSEANTRVEQARLEAQQAEADADRLEKLARDGAISQQQAEQARTRARTSAQVVRSTQDQVRNQQQAVAVADKRFKAQQAVVAEVDRRREFASLIAPVTGTVVEKVSEVGNLVQPGGEVLKLGDFSQIKVIVQVSELQRGNLRPNGAATVRLDAFPGKTLRGNITRISPAADPTARLIPVEVTIPNSGNQISSGLLARVRFDRGTPDLVVVPQTALQTRGGSRQKGAAPSASSGQTQKTPPTSGVVFVVAEGSPAPTVTSRSVRLGDRGDGKVQIISGLQPGERVVVRSGKPLEDGTPVRFSILSEQ